MISAFPKPSNLGNVQTSAASLNVNWSEIENTIKRWDEIHHYADQTLDISGLDTVLTGNALEQQINTIRDLKEKNCQWSFTDLSPAKVVSRTILSETKVLVDVQKHWDAKLYCNNSLDPQSSEKRFIAVYHLVKMNAGWRISSKDSR